MNEELSEALTAARADQRDAVGIAGLPADPVDAMTTLWTLQEPWKHGNRAKIMAQARKSFAAWIDEQNQAT